MPDYNQDLIHRQPDTAIADAVGLDPGAAMRVAKQTGEGAAIPIGPATDVSYGEQQLHIDALTGVYGGDTDPQGDIQQTPASPAKIRLRRLALAGGALAVTGLLAVSPLPGAVIERLSGTPGDATEQVDVLNNTPR